MECNEIKRQKEERKRMKEEREQRKEERKQVENTKISKEVGSTRFSRRSPGLMAPTLVIVSTG